MEKQQVALSMRSINCNQSEPAKKNGINKKTTTERTNGGLYEHGASAHTLALTQNGNL